ncbi:radical SAM protein, partial [uncultured Desulfovibrio sp.]|uniref:radical SAM protein n=1 Tax=uncultured Desulfovibrio sp. TaxID=167968 RepID=UPI0025E3C0C3
MWEIPARTVPVFSVFIPFFGCPRRCVFCSQHDQTGQQAVPLDEILARAAAGLRSRRTQGRPPAELAFYGGTFTALAPRDLDACLDMADSLRRDGCITRFRCSTRPDCLDAALLARLRRHGCRTVELGIQSFSDTALQAAERHYSGRQAAGACRLVRDAGLALGVQLLPGMPGHEPEDFLADVRRALALGADMLRFYPCLVLAGTELARRWQQGLYTPWPLPLTLSLLARGWLDARRAGVPVIRMGLAPEPGMEAALLAGPGKASDKFWELE